MLTQAVKQILLGHSAQNNRLPFNDSLMLSFNQPQLPFNKFHCVNCMMIVRDRVVLGTQQHIDIQQNIKICSFQQQKANVVLRQK